MFGVPFPFDFTLDRYVANMYHRNYEEAEVRCVRRCVSPGAVVLDVGANLGYLAAVAASACGPTGCVYALEPLPHIFDRLSTFAGLARGAGFRIEPRRLALGDRAGTIRVQTATVANIGWASTVPGQIPAHLVRDAHEAPLATGAAFVAAEGIRHVDFIKIDVEGAEAAVLAGLAEVLGRDRPLVLCEVSPGTAPLVGVPIPELFARMTALGYAAWRPGRWRDRPLGAAEVVATTNVLWRPA